MNPQRIEEFRKKLRAGHAARVRGGVVEVDGISAAPATPAPAAAPPAAAPAVPPSEGVQVKPHEWGRL